MPTHVIVYVRCTSPVKPSGKVVLAVAVATPVFGRTKGANCEVAKDGVTWTFTMCAGESLFPLSLFVTVHVIGVGVVVPLHAPPVAEVEGEGQATALEIPNRRPIRSTTAPPANRAVFFFSNV